MKKLVLSNKEATANPNFEEGWDFCLVTPIDNTFEMTYFNAEEGAVIMLKDSTGDIKVNVHSVLCTLTKKGTLSPCPNLGCPNIVKEELL